MSFNSAAHEEKPKKKRNPVVLEASPVEKKKKKKKKPKSESRELALVSEKPKKYEVVKRKRGRPKKIQTKIQNASELANTFGGDARKIQKLLRLKDDDSAILKTQRSLLNMLIEMIPIAENTYRTYGTQSAAYAMNALVSQVRELMQDIVSSQDRQLAADNIIATIINPNMLSFAQFILDNNHQLIKEVTELVPVERAKDVQNIVNKSSRNVGIYIQTMLEDFRNRIQKELSD